MIDHLVPSATTTYRIQAVGIKKPLAKGHQRLQDNGGSSSGSTNNASATTSSQDTTGWYKVKITGGMNQAYASWQTANQGDGLGVLPQYNDQWFYAGSWQAAVWAAVSGQAKVYVTDYGDGHSPGDIVTHDFKNKGWFQIGTGAEIAAKSGVTDFKLPHGPSDRKKLITLEDSYGAIDRDYDDFYWVVDVIGVKSPELKIQSTAFIKQNYLDAPGEFSSPYTIFQGDDRDGPVALFDPENNNYRARSVLTTHPMDVFFNDDLATLKASSTFVPSTGISAQYDKASSVVGGVISAAAHADAVLNDGFLKIAQGKAPTTGIEAFVDQLQDHKVRIKLVTSTANPLRVSPDIDVTYMLTLDYSDPLHPTYELFAYHDGFPCYELAVNGNLIYNFDSGTNSPWELFGGNDVEFSSGVHQLPPAELIP